MRRIVPAALAVLAAGATAVVAATVTAAPAQGAPQKSLRFYEHDTQQVSVDLGAPGAGPGDLFDFAGDLLDHRGGTKLGRTSGACTTTGSDVLCTVTFVVNGGQISTQGLFDGDALFGGQLLPFAITGGTGVYRGAHGEATVRVPTDVPNQTDAEFVLNPT